jgi:putative membrane protein
MRPISLTTAAIAALALTACASANSETAMSASGAGSPVAANAPMTPDEFAAEAARSDAYEIQSGQLAQTRGSSPMVKQMGAMLVKDHTMTTNRLMAALTAVNRPKTPPPLDARRRDMIAQLEKAQGAEFDRLFMQQQVTAHQEALALHRGYAASGTVPQLKTVAAEASKVVEGHLQHLQSHAAH